MTITFPISLPRPEDIDGITIKMQSMVAVSASPYTGHQQIYRHPGQLWLADVNLALLPRASADPWNAFLASLYGPFGTFLMGDPNGGVPRGGAVNSPGTPLVSLASQSGDTIPIYGAVASASAYLQAGDYVQVGSYSGAHFYKVLQQVDTTSGGVATIQIWPMLRSAPASGEVMYVQSCQGVWRLSSMPEWDIQGPNLYGIRFSAVEAL